MSEDPTQNIEQKYDTKPTIETLLTEMRAGFAQVNARIDGLEQKMEKRFDAVEFRLDDLSNKVSLLNEDVLQLRSDFKMIRKRVEGLESHFKEPA
jgi:tetrahydromethanopterin S-methyltransferase subunit G